MVPNATEYKFGHKTYRTGFLIKSLPPASVVIADAPNDIGPFVRSPYITQLPFFDAMTRCYAQYSLIIGQQVQVISGEQQGVVGHAMLCAHCT
jgi:hypothetical protein